jgi:hypothetical protein
VAFLPHPLLFGGLVSRNLPPSAIDKKRKAEMLTS